MKSPLIPPSSHARIRLVSGGAIVIMLLMVALTIAMVAPAKERPKLVYAAWVASSTEPRGCLGPSGVYAELSTNVKPRVKLSELKQLAAKNKPKAAQMRVGGKSYRLSVDTSSSAYGNGQIAWGFKRIKLSQASAKKLIGKRAAVSYHLGSKVHNATPVRVADGSCRAPF